MNKAEGITQKGVGVEYKKNVTVRGDRIGGHGDMAMAGTQAAYKKANTDTKKA